MIYHLIFGDEMVTKSDSFDDLDKDVHQQRHASFYKIAMQLNSNNHVSNETRYLAQEMPVALSYDGTTHAVMMALPQDLIDFAYGFSLTEGLISHPDEIVSIDIIDFADGIDIQMTLMPLIREAFQARRRNMAGPVGCGLCGIESIDAAMRDTPIVTSDITLNRSIISKAANLIHDKQQINHMTRATHAAGFYNYRSDKMIVREDVGRHNALDKLCGYLFRNAIALEQGVVVVTSRLSVEMVQKTAWLGVSTLIALSAPTAQAVKIGEKAGMTLIARARGDNFEIYCGNQRIE